MIGDTMETDILGGVSMGYRTTLVLSGSTGREDLKRYAYRPDLVIDSLADLCDESVYRNAVGEVNGVVVSRPVPLTVRSSKAEVAAR
jgi:NagD protein